MKKFFLVILAIVFVGLQGLVAFALSWRNPHFLLKRAQIAFKEKDYPMAIDLLDLPVKKGNLEAMKLMILCHYEQGLYLAQKKQLEEACKYWELSAKYSYAPAELALANCYAEGDGVPRDQGKAIELYKLAGEHGSDEAKDKWLSFDCKYEKEQQNCEDVIHCWASRRNQYFLEWMLVNQRVCQVIFCRIFLVAHGTACVVISEHFDISAQWKTAYLPNLANFVFKTANLLSKSY